MPKKALSQFKKGDLFDILKSFGKQPRIFNSEAQFQFDLGWRVKELFDCDVKFEEYSREISVTSPKGKVTSKKDYTDLILEKGNLHIAIELKYKTAKYPDAPKNILLKEHGAADLGRYDFMWDIHRVQELTNSNKEDGIRIPCDWGYAIILTNDKHYWNTSPNNNVPQNVTVIDKDFFIGGDEPNNTYIRQGDHDWQKINGQYPKVGKSRKETIHMDKDYPYKWEDYCTISNAKNGAFRFMIIEIR